MIQLHNGSTFQSVRGDMMAKHAREDLCQGVSGELVLGDPPPCILGKALGGHLEMLLAVREGGRCSH